MMNVVLGVLLLVLGGLTPFPAAADVFCDNLKVVAATLPKNTSSSPVHFATATVGQAPNVVYALALCRGDVVNGSACGECVANTFDKIFNATPPEQQCYKAAYWYGDCTLVFSDDNILDPSNTTEQNDDTPFERWNIKNVTGDVSLIVGLIHELLVETVQRAASTTPRRFATGVMDSGTNFPLVYSLAQCTPDLSAGDCLACLNRLLGMVNSTMSLRMGAQIHVIRCYFRYEASQFYSSQPILHLGPPLAPAPAPTPKHKGRMSKLWAIPMVVIPLLAVAFLCFIFYFRRHTRQRKGNVRSRSTQDLQGEEQLVWEGKNSEFSVFEFDQVLEATDNFSEENKLGQGGFGAVYKRSAVVVVEGSMGRLPSSGGPAFRFLPAEVAEMEARLQQLNNGIPTSAVLQTLAEMFSASPERAGKVAIQPKQNRRYWAK